MKIIILSKKITWYCHIYDAVENQDAIQKLKYRYYKNISFDISGVLERLHNIIQKLSCCTWEVEGDWWNVSERRCFVFFAWQQRNFIVLWAYLCIPNWNHHVIPIFFLSPFYLKSKWKSNNKDMKEGKCSEPKYLGYDYFVNSKW